MRLSFSPPPEFRNCSTKVFAPREEHVTRKYHKSVLILMMDGVLRFREDGEVVELCAGEYYIQRDGLFQEGVRIDAPPTYFYIEFRGCYTEDSEAGLPLRGRFQKQKILTLLGRFEEFYKVHRADPFLPNSYMNRVFSELWIGSPFHDEQPHVIRLIRNDIEARYSETVSLSELSRRFGYTTDHITRMFKQQYGTTPHQYQIKLRMEHAAWLLDNTDLGVERIAEAVGYRDFSAFWRAYRKAYGISPGEARML